MKMLARVLMIPAAAACLIAQAPGQITITASDLQTVFAVGDSLANKIDKVTASLDVGLHGSTSWDFSGLRNDSSQTLTSVSPAGTPFVGLFSNPTYALKANLIVSYQGNPIPATGYIYLQLNGDLLNQGEAADVAGAATLKSFNIPADVFYRLPSTYGTSWTSTYLDTTTVTLNSLPIVLSATGVRHNNSFVIDAYGPMTLPGGSVHNALRIKKTDNNTGAVSFVFLAKDGASVQATSANPAGADSGVISVVPGTVSWNLQVVSLPIQLASFVAAPASGGQGVVLSWTTKSEVNNYGFEVQRSAHADAGFAAVPNGFIAGHGTTVDPQTYTFVDAGAPAGVSYYRLKQTDLDGAVHYTDPEAVTLSGTAPGGDVPAAFFLDQNYPNPFNPATTIRYGLPVRTTVSLSVYNALGQRVAAVADGEQDAGIHEVRFDASALSSGVYFYRIQTPQFVRTLKFELVK